MNYKNDCIAAENIPNLSLCCRVEGAILPITDKVDLNGNLVLVNNITPFNETSCKYIITAGSCVRYVDIVILPKIQL